MNEGVAWIGLIGLGGAIWWTVHLFFTMERRPVESSFVVSLRIAALTMIFLGLCGMVTAYSSAVGFIVFLGSIIVSVMVVNRYRLHLGQAFLLQMSLARQYGLPLIPAARAFASERTDEIGARVLNIANQMEQGVALEQAVERARLPLSNSGLLAARLGVERPHWRASMRDTSSSSLFLPEVSIGLLQRLLYLSFLPLFGYVCVWLLMLKIVPTFRMIMEDFELPLPPATAFFIAIAEAPSGSSALAIVLYWLSMLGFFLLAFVAVAGILYYAGWLRWEPPLLRRVTAMHHGAIVMRVLASMIESNADLILSLKELAVAYPTRYVRRRLIEVADTAERGGDWIESLRQQRLVSPSVASVLLAARRSHHLAWALREMSDATVRRIARRVQRVTQIVTPFALIAIAIPIGFVAVAILQPLVSLIQVLAQ